MFVWQTHDVLDSLLLSVIITSQSIMQYLSPALISGE